MTAAKKIILALCLVLLGLAYAPAAVALDAPGNRTWEKIGVSPQTPLAENSQVPGTHQTNGLTAYDPASGCSLAAEGTAAVAEDAGSWIWSESKGAAKSIRQMNQRGWTPQQVTEAIKGGEQFPARNLVNPNNPAIRYVHPVTGQSVVQDTVTNEILHFGGPGFLY
jgi:hypothetical protein